MFVSKSTYKKYIFKVFRASTYISSINKNFPRNFSQWSNWIWNVSIVYNQTFTSELIVRRLRKFNVLYSCSLCIQQDRNQMLLRQDNFLDNVDITYSSQSICFLADLMECLIWSIIIAIHSGGNPGWGHITDHSVGSGVHILKNSGIHYRNNLIVY